MPRIINTRQVVRLKKGRGIDGDRLSMCDSDKNMEVDSICSSSPISIGDKGQMDEMISKLSKIKIINPKNSSRAKFEIKNKYITI